MNRWTWLGASVLGAGLVVGPARGTTRHVPSEYATINKGLTASVAGDTVLVAPGTYTDYEVRDLGDMFPWKSCAFLVAGVVLKSEAGPAVTIIDMQHAPGPQAEVVLARNVGPVETPVEGFTITGAPVSGHGGYLIGRVTCDDCVFRDLDAGESSGGGIAGNADLMLRSCEFLNCRATAGGAIANYNGWLEMHDCYVHDCLGIAVLGSGDLLPGKFAVIENCTFSGNTNHALKFEDYTVGFTVRTCRFENNHDYGTGGGAIGYGWVGPGAVIEDCLFLNNVTTGANARGGAIAAGGSSTIRRCTFWGNYAPTSAGGDAVAFISSSALCTLEENVIAGSTGQGAVYVRQMLNLTTSCNVFWANAGGQGRYFTLGPTDRVIDPLFCDVAAQDFHVMTGSPCVPPGSLDCGQIGEFGVGCGATSAGGSVESRSWGEIKSEYRGQERSRP